MLAPQGLIGYNITYLGDPQPPILPTTSPPGPGEISDTAITTVAVVVTLCVVASLVIIVIVVVIVTVVMKRRKRASEGYSFRQLTDINDDKDEPDM